MVSSEGEEKADAGSSGEAEVSPADAAADAENTVEELRVLVDLHDQGKLSDKELAERRAKLLG